MLGVKFLSESKLFGEGPSRFCATSVTLNLTIPNQLLDNNSSLQYDWCALFIMFLYSLVIVTISNLLYLY